MVRIRATWTVVIIIINGILIDGIIEDFKEELGVESLVAPNKTSVRFSFVTTIEYSGAEVKHARIFPHVISDLVTRYGINWLSINFSKGTALRIPQLPTGVELVASFSNGNGDDVDKRWRGVANVLSGMLCASLNFIGQSNSIEPVLGMFDGGGGHNNSKVSSVRYVVLPRENVCTENLTPWIKLLPCKDKMGLGRLIRAASLYSSGFHAISLHIRRQCLDEKCTGSRLTLTQQTSSVGRKAEDLIAIGSGVSGACPVASSSVVRNVDNAPINDEISVERTVTTSTEALSGGINVNIFNHTPHRNISVSYMDVLPWYLRIYIHTLHASNNGQPIDIHHLHYQPARDRGRPTQLEIQMEIPPLSRLTIHLGFDKRFLRYTEHPPDAHRGFDLAPAVIGYHDSKGDWRLVYSNNLLIGLPTPDFSMPYNVITLTCTVLALLFGSVFNLVTRDFVPIQSDV